LLLFIYPVISRFSGGKMNFQEAEIRFQELEKKWAGGQLNEPAYRAALVNLRVTGPSGEVWMLQEHTGRWFVFRAGLWVEARRPLSAPAVAARPVSTQAPTPRHAQPGPARQPDVRQQAGAWVSRPVSPPKKQAMGGGLRLLLISGVLVACLVCAAVGVNGYLIYTGRIQLPPQLTGLFPQLSFAAPDGQPGSADPAQQSDNSSGAQVAVKPVETVAAPADGAPHADSHGVTLAVPGEALAEGGQVNLAANDLQAPWRKTIESAVSIDTPFYSLAAQGKNDTNGSLSISFPAANPGSRILAVIDNEYLVELGQAPQNGQLTLKTRAGPTDTTGLKPPPDYDGSGSIYYAVITPKSALRLPAGSQLAAWHNQADERNCIPDLSIIGGAAINLCRQNPTGTLQVMLPTTKRDFLPQVDMMVDKIEAVMKKYNDLGFTAAQLSTSSPMLVRVSTKVSSPSYYPLNGVLYIPVDTVSKIATLSPTDVYHEMAHWIQAVKYSTRIAYYSGERTWWLETSAENMVMLVEPSYVGKNLATYGTISGSENGLALQDSSYQWPGDYYVQAQLVKVNLCDSANCPLSPASFAKAISEGVYPLMDGGKKAQVSENLKDYAFYLLGKPPALANSAIPLSGPVKSGEGYGEYIRVTRTTNTDIKYDYNGSDPQMRKDSKDGKDAVAIEAKIKKDGVYPLMVAGGQGEHPGLPVELDIEPGAPFYYTIDDGDLKYSDGSKELKLLPIHGAMGIKKVRLVAMGENGGEVFKARVQPLDLQGAWVVMVTGAKTGGSMTCGGGSGKIDNPDGTAQLMAYILSLASGTGDMKTDPTGRSLDWSAVASRVPAQFTKGNLTYKATALLSGEAVQFQANVDLPRASDESGLPPAAPLAAAVVGAPLLWRMRKRLNPRSVRVVTNLLLIAFLALVSTGCFGMGMYGSATLDAKLQKIEYVGGQDTGVLTASKDVSGTPTGKPLWKMTGTGTYDVTFNIETTVTDADGKDTTEVNICTGKVTYPIVGFIYKDFQVQIPEK
jgi:hypothetical protein